MIDDSSSIFITIGGLIITVAIMIGLNRDLKKGVSQ